VAQLVRGFDSCQRAYSSIFHHYSWSASSAGPRCVMGRSRSGEGLRNLVKKNGAGVTSASKFLRNLEYKQDIKKRRETCKLNWRLLGRGRKHFLTIRFVVHTNVARIKLPSLTKQV
jgi:hypothetical protein